MLPSAGVRSAAPVKILKRLLQEFPGALYLTDNKGSLPLHFACQGSSPSLEVLQFLWQQDPTAVRTLDNTGSLPLHRLCRANSLVDAVTFLLAAYEGSISMRTNIGELPFIVACKSRASLSVILVMLRAHPDALQGFYNPR